jgi:hypothetical protein
LLVAAGTVGFLHSILPDHWVPLAVVARTRRWSIVHTARVSLLASVGHVLTSIVLGGILALVGLQFRSRFEAEQNHIVGAVLVVTGIGFVIWGLMGGGHEYSHVGHDHAHPEDGEAAHVIEIEAAGSSMARRLAGIAVPFGAAASPDLTILPIFLAASAVGAGAVFGVLATFSAVTLTTFVVLTVAATLAGYQVKGEWLEEHANTITGVVLMALGAAVYLSLF